MIVQGLTADGSARGGPSSPWPKAPPAWEQLHAAETSLARGSGPAGGAHMVCTGSPAPQCGVAQTPHPQAGGSALWLNLTKPHAPSGRETMALAYDSADGYVLLFGGGTWNAFSNNGETWTFSAGTWTQLTPTPSPGPRMGAGLAYDAADGYVVMFGGYDRSGGGFDGDTWTFLAGVWTFVNASTHPSARWGMGMDYDANDGYVLLFGGEGGFGNYQGDTWKFVSGAWSPLSPTSSPSNRGDNNMAYDGSDKEVVLYSGEAGGSAYNDTWTYSGGVWTNLTKNLSLEPIAETANAISYDPGFAGVILEQYQSLAGGPTFLFSAGNWTQLTASTYPPGQYHAKAAYDRVDGYLVDFGGQLYGTSSVTWNQTWTVKRAAPFLSLSVSPSEVDLTQSALFSLTAFPVVAGDTYRYSGLPSPCVSANTSALACVPTSTGNFTVNANATSPAGKVITSQNVTLVVDPLPSVGSLTAAPGAITLGRPVNLTTRLSAGTPPLTFLYSGAPSGCPSVNRSWLVCTPTGAGWFNVTVTVTDSRGGRSAGLTPLRVNGHLTLTQLVVHPSPTIDVREPIQFTAAQGGGTPTITFTWTGLPPGCGPVDAANLSCAPSSDGSFNVTLNASDPSGASARQTIPLTISADPTVGPLLVAPSQLDLGSTIAISANLTGGTAPFTVLWTGLPPGCPNSPVLSFTCVPTGTGTFLPKVTATDSAGVNTNASASITITPLPHIVAVSYPASGWDVDRPFPITVVATGGSGALSYLLESTGSPGGCHVGPSPNVTICNETQPGSFTFRAVVHDALGHNSSFGGAIALHALPAIGGFIPFPATATLGEDVNFSFSVTGGTGPFQYKLAGFAADCAQNTPAFGFTCAPLQTGTYTVTLQVTDAVGASSNASTEVVITPARQTPSAGTGALGATDLLLIAIAVVAVGGALLYVIRGRRGPPPVRPSPGAGEPREMEPVEPPG
ncbi:MAG: kelch repeat-containing protein [Thermoplasmata archaeon]|nr:kelch repeat-containing protein [Thermoplasmata archaeon]